MKGARPPLFYISLRTANFILRRIDIEISGSAMPSVKYDKFSIKEPFDGASTL